MRANYGKSLRAWLQQYQINTVLDFGDLPVFEDAVTYPCILALEKTPPHQKLQAANIDEIVKTRFEKKVAGIAFPMEQPSLSVDGWNLADERVHRLMEKIRSAGVPLGEYVEGKIYRGILTGLNEAFVINSEVKEQIITADPHSVDIIKPFLSGRDIKRGVDPLITKWLIFERRGIEIEKYPAVYQYLLQYQSQLEPMPKKWVGPWQGRKPGNYKWYEIQDAVDYYREFERPKIVLPDIAIQCQAVLMTKPCYIGNTAYIIPVEDNFLVSVLNCSVVDFFYRNLTSSIRGGYLRFIRQYLEQIPIPVIENGNTAATTDQIFDLYNLTAEERIFIENQ